MLPPPSRPAADHAASSTAGPAQKPSQPDWLLTTYITDPARDTVLMNTRLQAVPGSGANLARLHLYTRLDAHVNANGGGGDQNAGANSGVVDPSGVPVIFSTNTATNAANRDYAVPTYMALAGTSAQAASVGYAGTASDGLTQLDATHTLTPYTSAATRSPWPPPRPGAGAPDTLRSPSPTRAVAARCST